MWLRCKYQWLAAILIAGVSILAGGAFAEEERAPAELVAPSSPETDSPAPRHRMDQALIGQRPRCDARTLGDMLRHLGCGQDACCLCGKPCGAGEDDAHDRGAGRSPVSKPPFFQRFFACDGDSGGDAEFSAERKAADLRPGEPAQVIIDLKRRLGRDVYEGTQFGGSPDVLVDWIRALDEESRRQPPESNTDEPARNPASAAPSPPTTDAAIEIDALRKAARKLGEAADLLEEQNLFDAADEVRSEADALRRRARERFEAATPAIASDAPPNQASSRREQPMRTDQPTVRVARASTQLPSSEELPAATFHFNYPLGADILRPRPFNFFLSGQRSRWRKVMSFDLPQSPPFQLLSERAAVANQFRRLTLAVTSS